MFKRRTPDEVSSMELIVAYYLDMNNNNPHLAYQQFKLDCQEKGRDMPHFIHGKKDFLHVHKIYEQAKKPKNDGNSPGIKHTPTLKDKQ